MKRAAHAVAWAVFSCCLAGCAGDKDGSSARTTVTTRHSSGDPLLEKYAGNFDYRKSTDGTQRVVSDRRSSFEGKEAEGYGKTVDRKGFHTGAYTTKPWWGSKDYTTQAYAGPTDGSRFQKSSRLAGKKAREGSLVSPDADTVYKTNNYATHAAHEASVKRLNKPADALVESRRAVYQPPQIIDWRQARKMEMNETRSILGRE